MQQASKYFTVDQWKEFITSTTQHSKDGCWLWTKALTTHGGWAACGTGRPVFGTELVNRISYILFRNPDLSTELENLCTHKNCVNPWHWKEGNL